MNWRNSHAGKDYWAYKTGSDSEDSGRQRAEYAAFHYEIKKRIFWENIVTLFNFLNFTIAAFFVCGGSIFEYAFYCYNNPEYSDRYCTGT